MVTGTDKLTSDAVDWLLSSEQPSVCYLTRRDLLDVDDPGERKRAAKSGWIGALLSGQQADGSFGSHPYKKWTGAHWRLVSLVELGVSPHHPGALRALDTVLDWLTSEAHLRGVVIIDGLARRCASQEGNALAVAVRLGVADDPRVAQLARSLMGWQWPDGGWNCAAGNISSVHETLSPMWGLHEYAAATGDADARRVARAAAEVFLTRRLFRSRRTGEVIRREWLALHYPPYWHYDVLQGLLVLSRMGLTGDARATEALDHLERRCQTDGRWRPGAYWWAMPGRSGGSPEVVDWGRSAPSPMITLNALRVLRAAGRLGFPPPVSGLPREVSPERRSAMGGSGLYVSPPPTSWSGR